MEGTYHTLQSADHRQMTRNRVSPFDEIQNTFRLPVVPVIPDLPVQSMLHARRYSAWRVSENKSDEKYLNAIGPGKQLLEGMVERIVD